MIRDAELIDALLEAGEGEMIMAGKLLRGLSDEDIAWVVIESVATPEGVRVTLHAYWHDIFVVSKVVTIKNSKLVWGATAA